MNLTTSFVLANNKFIKIFLLCLFSIFIFWSYYCQSRNLPKDTFEDSEYVIVKETNDEFLFKTTIPMIKKELIFLHGTLNDPKAFAPLCRKLAMHGFTCHLIKMDWRLPQCSYSKIMKMFDIEQGNYFIGGFSRGGELAAQLVSDNPDIFLGLFLLDTKLPLKTDLSHHKIRCLNLTSTKIESSNSKATKLPIETKYTLISGGIHSQFGYFSEPLTKPKSSISMEEQQEQIFLSIVNFVR